MSIVSISASSIDELKQTLSDIDSVSHLLYFEKYPAQEFIGRTFIHDNHTFVIDCIDSEDHEIPLVTAIRKDIYDLRGDELDPWDFDNVLWDLSDEEKPYEGFNYEFLNHSGWNTKAIPYYARNIPNVEDGSLIGFYWLPIPSIINFLDVKDVSK